MTQTNPNRPFSNSLLRRLLEHGLHVVAITAMAIALYLMLAGQGARPAGPVDGSDLADRLSDWTRHPPSQLIVQLDSLPELQHRDWLAALHAAGSEVVWSNAANTGVPALGLSVDPVADPHQPVRIWAALGSATGGELLGSLPADPPVKEPLASLPGSAAVTVASPSGAVLIETPLAEAVANRRDSLEIKSLLLLGQASWEARFAAAALEEHGWRVDARLSLSPTQVVGQMPPERPQTQAPQARPAQARAPQSGGRGTAPARGGRVTSNAPIQQEMSRPEITIENYSAVLLLDETETDPQGALAAYVNAGGGLIVFPDAVGMSGVTQLLPARGTGIIEEAQPFQDLPVEQDNSGPARHPRDYMELRPLTNLTPAAHVLERRDDAVAVAIRRHGEGRVLQLGYADLWRWQMSAPEATAPEDYRAWLAGLISSVAHARREEFPLTAEQTIQKDPAPLAAWHTAFGAPRSVDADPGDNEPLLTPIPKAFWLLLAIAGTALLAEWLLRRLRNLA